MSFATASYLRIDERELEAGRAGLMYGLGIVAGDGVRSCV